MAVNCWVEPTVKLAVGVGAIVMEDKVGVGVFDEHAITPKVKAAITTIVRL